MTSLAVSPLAGAAVLAADDHADSLDLLELILLRAGAHVRTAGTGKDVLELVGTFRPDVLLLDITLPDMDGYELLRQLRAMPGLASTPAVAVTGHAYESDKAAAESAGFAVHVTKPFDREALLHTIRRLAAAAISGSDRPADPPSLAAFREVLGERGVAEALRYLNARTTHRFTGIYRFDGPTLRSLFLVDRLDAATTQGNDAPSEATFCSRVGLERQTFETNDAMADAAVGDHPARERVQAYCGALLRNADGTPFGSLCHFDPAPLVISSEERALLEAVAPWLALAVAA